MIVSGGKKDTDYNMSKYGYHDWESCPVSIVKVGGMLEVLDNTSVNVQQERNKSLCGAAAKHDADAISFLVAEKADINCCRGGGWLPLEREVTTGVTEFDCPGTLYTTLNFTTQHN